MSHSAVQNFRSLRSEASQKTCTTMQSFCFRYSRLACYRPDTLQRCITPTRLSRRGCFRRTPLLEALVTAAKCKHGQSACNLWATMRQSIQGCTSVHVNCYPHFNSSTTIPTAVQKPCKSSSESCPVQYRIDSRRFGSKPARYWLPYCPRFVSWST